MTDNSRRLSRPSISRGLEDTLATTQTTLAGTQGVVIKPPLTLCVIAVYGTLALLLGSLVLDTDSNINWRVEFLVADVLATKAAVLDVIRKLREDVVVRLRTNQT